MLAIAGALSLLTGVASSGTSDPSALGFLLDLPGDLVNVRYSPGSLERAVRVQERFDLLLEDFRSWSRQSRWSREAIALVVFLLSREEWDQAGFRTPYGLPSPMGGRGLALSAWGDQGTVDLWESLMSSRLPMVPGQPLRGTPEQAASLAVGDVLGMLEASRILLAAGGYRGDRPWVQGILAHVVTLAVIQRHERARIPEVRQVFASLASAGGGPAAYPVSATDSPESLSASLWFEAQFFEAASLLAAAEGKPPAKLLMKHARKQGGTIRATDLMGRYPELGNWLEASFRQE